MTFDLLNGRYTEDSRLAAARKQMEQRCRTAQKPSDYDDARKDLLRTIEEINGGPIAY